MSPRLVRCKAGHPGLHVETHACIDPERESSGSRLARLLESALNPKQGREGDRCPGCGNGLLLLGGCCVYCDRASP